MKTKWELLDGNICLNKAKFILKFHYNLHNYEGCVSAYTDGDDSTLCFQLICDHLWQLKMRSTAFYLGRWLQIKGESNEKWLMRGLNTQFSYSVPPFNQRWTSFVLHVHGMSPSSELPPFPDIVGPPVLVDFTMSCLYSEFCSPSPPCYTAESLPDCTRKPLWPDRDKPMCHAMIDVTENQMCKDNPLLLQIPSLLIIV